MDSYIGWIPETQNKYPKWSHSAGYWNLEFFSGAICMLLELYKPFKFGTFNFFFLFLGGGFSGFNFI